MKERLKTSGVDVTKFVDVESGELLGEDIHKHQFIVGEDSFHLVYTSCLNIIQNWELNISDLQMFAYICEQYSTGQEFQITKTIKEKLATMNRKSFTSYNNSTRNLLSKNLIVRISAKSYRINPRFVWKGSTNNRKKALIEILNICPDC